jgi:lycopene cyclase domain-containing protein
VTHTTAVLIGVAATVALDLVVLRTRLLTRRVFWTAYAIVLFFQLLTNQWLTARGVFVYDPDAIIGWRIGTAPVEDFLFGFALVTQSMAWWVWWGRRGVQRTEPRGPSPALARLATRRRR